MQVQLEELLEYFYWAKTLKVTAHGGELVQCGFAIQAAKEVLRVLLVCVEGDEGDILAALGLLPAQVM